MSTRAMYSFIDDGGKECYHVYKHHDGYPVGALGFIKDTLERAWALPRYEADEFAAAFVVATKSMAGGTRLMESGPWKKVAACDIAYRYEVYPYGEKRNLRVKGFEVWCDFGRENWTEREILDISIDDIDDAILQAAWEEEGE